MAGNNINNLEFLILIYDNSLLYLIFIFNKRNFTFIRHGGNYNGRDVDGSEN